MANRYWVGTSGAVWGTTSSWSATSGGAPGASIPTVSDDVFFDANSTGNSAQLTSSGMICASINFTGYTNLINKVRDITVNGSLTFSSTMTITDSGGNWIITGPGTITTAGKSIYTLEIACAAGSTVTLGGALTATFRVLLTSGTFSTSASNYSITALRLTATSSGTRVINLNGSTVTLTGSGTALDLSGSTITLNAGTSTINCTGVSQTFAGGSKTFYNVAFTSTGVGSIVITGANTFNNLTFTAPASAANYLINIQANQTITTLVASGASAVRRLYFYSLSVKTLTITNWSTISDLDFTNISLNSLRSGTRLGNRGGNTNITFPAAKSVYWNLAGTQDWTAAAWATTAGGAPSINNFPLAQDTAIFTNTGAAGTVTFNSSFPFTSLNMSGRTSAMTISGTPAAVTGNWSFGTGVTVSGLGTVTFAGGTTQTVSSAGKSFAAISVSGTSTNVSLGSAFESTSTITVGAGASFTSNTYSVSAVSLSASTSTIGFGSATWTLSGTGTVINTASATVTGTAEIILSDTTTTARTLSLGNKTYGKLTIGGATGTSTTTISGTAGLTFSEISSTKTVAHTIVFPNITTTVGAFTVNGSDGNLVTLSRTGASGVFTLAKSGGGTVTVEYLSISNSTVTPSSTWYATNSIDAGGNTGWSFVTAGGGGNFIAFLM